MVLHALSLRIVAGQHTALLGPNGCGKSSFIKLINRELYPLAREGETPVKVMGRSRWKVNELRTRLGVVTGDLSRDLQDMPGLDAESAVLTGFFASLDAAARCGSQRRHARTARARHCSGCGAVAVGRARRWRNFPPARCAAC